MVSSSRCKNFQHNLLFKPSDNRHQSLHFFRSKFFLERHHHFRRAFIYLLNYSLITRLCLPLSICKFTRTQAFAKICRVSINAVTGFAVL